MSDPLVQVLTAHFDSMFEGPSGDYPAVLEAVNGFSVAGCVEAEAHAELNLADCGAPDRLQ